MWRTLEVFPGQLPSETALKATDADDEAAFSVGHPICDPFLDFVVWTDPVPKGVVDVEVLMRYSPAFS